MGNSHIMMLMRWLYGRVQRHGLFFYFQMIRLSVIPVGNCYTNRNALVILHLLDNLPALYASRSCRTLMMVSSDGPCCWVVITSRQR